MRLTLKQRQILEAICEGIADKNGTRIGWPDVEMICERVPYEVNRHAMRISLRFLEKKNMVGKCEPVYRRDRWVVPIKPSHAAFDLIYQKVDAREFESDNEVVEIFW
jgi:hypothetical protein